MAVRLYWCETHERVADHAWVDGDARIWVCSMCDQTGFLGSMVERLLVDPSSLPEHAVEAAAKAIWIREGFGNPKDKPDAECNTTAWAAIRGFLESLSEEDK